MDDHKWAYYWAMVFEIAESLHRFVNFTAMDRIALISDRQFDGV